MNCVNFLGGGSTARGVAGNYGELCSFTGESVSNGKADTAACSGNHNSFS
jgi:hypothetical protein